MDVRRTCPLPVEEAVQQCEDQEEMEKMKQDLLDTKYFPTSAMYTRQTNFLKMDLECLFFAFYYQQGTYQQYLAAQELKKRGWDFHTRFLTWMKKEQNSDSQTTRGKQSQKVKTLYFDYENEWRIKSSLNNEFQTENSKQIEKELQIPQ